MFSGEEIEGITSVYVDVEFLKYFTRKTDTSNLVKSDKQKCIDSKQYILKLIFTKDAIRSCQTFIQNETPSLISSSDL